MKKILIGLILAALLLLSACGSEEKSAQKQSSKQASSLSVSSQVSSESSTDSKNVSSSKTTSSTASKASSSAGSSSRAVSHSPSSQSTAPAKPPAVKTVTITIDGRKGGGTVVLNNFKATYQSGDTVYSILRRACLQKGIPLDPSSGSGSVYVTSIDGVMAGTGMNGWIYTVNGSVPGIGCNLYKLQAGQTVKWIYTLDGNP